MLTTTENFLWFLFIFMMLGSTYAGWLIRAGFEDMKRNAQDKGTDDEYIH